MKLAYVLSSKAKKDAVHLLNKFNATGKEIDTLYLCSGEIDKILKKDVDLPESAFDAYDIIIPCGAEAFKYTCGVSGGITKYNGILVNSKFLPVLDPNIISIKPQCADDIKKAFEALSCLVNGVTPTVYEKDYRLVEAIEEFDAILPLLWAQSHLVADIETTSLSPRKGNILGLCLSPAPHKGFYVTAEIVKHFRNELQKLFNAKVIIFHNAKFDMAFLKYEFGFTFPQFEDTILMHYVLDESVGSHGLKQLAIKFTDLGDYDRELEDFKKTFCRQNKILMADFNYGMIPTEILAPYAMKDGDASYQLFNKFGPIVKRNEKFNFVYETILKPSTRALMHIENVGGPVSREYLDNLQSDYTIDIEEILNEINLHPAVQAVERTQGKAFNPNSVMQLRRLFFDEIGIKPTKLTGTGAYSTDAEVLEAIEHPLAEAILELRKKVKLTTTYIKNIRNGLDDDDRLRSSFNIIGTAAGRLSSSGVLNYQNIPRDKDTGIKQMFRANPGYKIVQADLGTAEVYFAATLSNDEFLQQAFLDGLDFHSYVAKNMFGLDCPVEHVKKIYPLERQAAKAITFGILYGAGPSKIAAEAGVSFEEAKDFIKLYFKQAKELKKWIDKENAFIINNCYTYSFFGRKRRLPEANAANKGVAAHAIRSGFNFLIQSVASDVNLMGLIDTVEWVEKNGYEDKIKIFATVHDSIVCECSEDILPEYSKMLKTFLQKDRGISIPGKPVGVDFEVGPSWGELTNYNV